MGMLIPLTRAEVECLSSHLPVGSDLRQKLTNSQITGSSNVRAIEFSNTLQCTIDEAQELLPSLKSIAIPTRLRNPKKHESMWALTLLPGENSRWARNLN